MSAHYFFFLMGVSAHFGLLKFLLRSALKFTHLKLILFYYEKKNYNRKEKRPKVFMVLNLCKIQVCLSVYLFNYFFFNSASASASYNSKKKKRKINMFPPITPKVLRSSFKPNLQYQMDFFFFFSPPMNKWLIN